VVVVGEGLGNALPRLGGDGDREVVRCDGGRPGRPAVGAQSDIP